MHRHYTSPERLRFLVRQFFGGEFILKKGRGKDTEVYSGKSDSIMVSEFPKREIVIHCRICYRQRIGCNSDFSITERWEAVTPPLGGLSFEYSWFYPQPKHARLKLESVPNNERCWLCSYEQPVHLALFRTMLKIMFLQEIFQKKSRFRKWRDRIVFLL